MSVPQIDTIIFDLGGVLIDWNPEYVFRTIFEDEAERKHFLTNITTSEWNEEQDAGRSLDEGTELLVAKHPEYEDAIRAFYGRWEEMLGGPIEGTVKILEALKAQNTHRIYALTNWSNETFPIALARYDFLRLFEGIVVSGQERMKKPDIKIYNLILDRYQIEPNKAVFIDDNKRNVEGAQKVGIHAIHFQSSDQLNQQLVDWQVLKA